jgi:hypothetical protein
MHLDQFGLLIERIPAVIVSLPAFPYTHYILTNTVFVEEFGVLYCDLPSDPS